LDELVLDLRALILPTTRLKPSGLRFEYSDDLDLFDAGDYSEDDGMQRDYDAT